jgi:uncharacterized YccA/Bax inhibitor family protein
MQSSNPVLTRTGTFTRVGGGTLNVPPTASTAELEAMYARPGLMTVDSVVLRTGILLAIIATTGAAAWVLDLGQGPAILAAIAGFVLAMVITFRRVASPPLIMAYAAVEGVFLGAISHAFNNAYPGIVVQAVLGTGTAFAGMLVAYRSGRIRVTPRFTKMVVGAAIGLLGLMVVNLVAGLFTSGGLGLRDGGPLAVVFSLVAIGVACLMLALDFDYVEKAIAAGAPERESWLGAFGLTVTLVWLYIEILRLISYLRD